MTQSIKLWSLNKEFDIRIEYPNTYNYPMLTIRDKEEKFLFNTSLRDISIKQAMVEFAKDHKGSDFLDRLFKQNGL